MRKLLNDILSLKQWILKHEDLNSILAEMLSIKLPDLAKNKL